MNEQLTAHLDGIVTTLQSFDLNNQIIEGEELIAALRDTIGKVAATRGSAMRVLRHDYKLQELADRFGLSPQRIAQILDR